MATVGDGNSSPIFRNGDKIQVLGFREWIRGELPTGSQGFVAEDLDLVVRVYGQRFDTDATGKFMLIELKHGQASINRSKKNTFGLIDSLLRKADPGRNRYRGYWVLNYDDEDWYQSSFWLNGTPISREDVWAFLMFISEPVPPLDFGSAA